MGVGDLLGSGTICGVAPNQYSWPTSPDSRSESAVFWGSYICEN